MGRQWAQQVLLHFEARGSAFYKLPFMNLLETPYKIPKVGGLNDGNIAILEAGRPRLR